MKHLLTFILSFLISFQLFATHIIGGNFQVTQTGANTFLVTLTVFRDCNTGNQGFVSAPTVYVKDNVTNASITTLTGWGTATITTPTIGDACFDPTLFGICVEKNVFTKTVTLSNNSNGYYLSYETCCRNGLTSNLDVGSLPLMCSNEAYVCQCFLRNRTGKQ